MVARKVKYCMGAVLASLFVFSACNLQSGRIETVSLIPVWYGDSCLYINAEDKVEFSGLYPSVSLFREDIALVQTAERDARIGFTIPESLFFRLFINKLRSFVKEWLL